MKRRSQVGLVFAIAAIALVGTALLLRQPGTTGSPRVSTSCHAIKDSTGRMVSIPTDPRRVLSLCTSATDTLIRLGAGDQLAAIDEYSRVVPGASDKVVIGKGSALSREQVLAMGIDLALVWWFQDDAAKLLNDLSVPVVRLRSGCMHELPEMIRLVGRCVNRAEAANGLAQNLTVPLRPLTNAPAPSPPRVYLELYGAYKTVGRDSFLNDLIELSGGRNIAADRSGGILLSAERLIQADPEIILFVGEITSANSIAQRSGLDQVSAVRNQRVWPVDRYWLVAGAGLPDAVAKLRALIIPTKRAN